MYSNRLARYSTVVLTLLLLNAPTLAMAAGLPGKIVSCDGTSANGGKECTVCDIATTAHNLLNTGIYVLIFLSAVIFAWAGFKMMTAGGDSEGYTKGKSMFTAVAVGLVIVLGGWIVIDTLMKTLVNQGGTFGPWNKIC